MTIQLQAGPNVDHHLCHLAAARRQREEVANNPILRYRVALVRERARLGALAVEREKLERRALELDVDIAVRRVQVGFLETAILDLERQAGEQCRGTVDAITGSTP